MKRTVSIMTLSLLTATTLATASPSDQMDFATLNQSDSHMLFGKTHHNSIALGQDEMMKTEGAWVVQAWGAAYGAASYAGYTIGSGGSWSWYDFGSATVLGAISGGAGAFVKGYHTTKALFFGGTALGVGRR